MKNTITRFNEVLTELGVPEERHKAVGARLMLILLEEFGPVMLESLDDHVQNLKEEVNEAIEELRREAA